MSKAGILPKLRTCEEMQKSGSSLERETKELLEVGIKTPSSLATAIVYRGINDLLVAVNQKSGDITLCTGSPAKLDELVSYNCVIPRSNNMQLESNLVKGLTIDLLNKYLQSEKYHFVKLVTSKQPSSLLLCQMYAFNPYPDFKDCNVYSLTDYDAWYKEVCGLMYNKYVELEFDGGHTCICTLSVNKSSVSGLKTLRSTNWVFDVVDVSGTPLRVPAFSIRGMYCYTQTELESKAMEGVVKIGGKLYTSNIALVSAYYGSALNSLESLAVRLRWASSDVVTGKIADMGYLYKKYGFYTEKTLPKFASVSDLVDYVSTQLIKPTEMGIQTVTLRQLGNPQAIRMGKSSYYRALKAGQSLDFEVVNPQDIVPQMYTYGNISDSLGYQALTMSIPKGYSVESALLKEFERQFGRSTGKGWFYFNKTEDGCKPLNLTTEMQRSLAESLMSGDYKNNFNDYKDKVYEMLRLNDAQFYCDLSVQFMFINKLVKYLRQEKKTTRLQTLGDLATTLAHYLIYCRDTPNEEQKKDVVDEVFRHTSLRLDAVERILGRLNKEENQSWVFEVDYKKHLITVKYIPFSTSVTYKYALDGNSKIKCFKRQCDNKLVE